MFSVQMLSIQWHIGGGGPIGEHLKAYRADISEGPTLILKGHYHG